MNDLENVSLIIKTFERKKCLDRLLTSIKDQGYDQCPILVADDSEKPYRNQILTNHGDIVNKYITLPFDSGVSKGRNILLEQTNTDFFIINDDDFVYYDETNIEKALIQIKQKEYDILSGYLLEKKKKFKTELLPKNLSISLGLYEESWKEMGWTADITINEDKGVKIESTEESQEVIHECDLVPQFFIARTDRVYNDVGGWNPKIKTFGEHWEFFYRAKKANLDIAKSNDWSALHIPDGSEKYSKYRNEREEETIKKSIKCANIPYLVKNNKIYKQ